MDKNIIKKWDANKKVLERHFKEDIQEYHYCDYVQIVKAVVECILNDGTNVGYNSDSITVVDHGDWQGSQVFLIPEDTYQPTPLDYLVTYQFYGSCSGCDSLQYIHDIDDEEEKVKNFMTLSLHLIQNMKPLYTKEEYFSDTTL